VTVAWNRRACEELLGSANIASSEQEAALTFVRIPILEADTFRCSLKRFHNSLRYSP